MAVTIQDVARATGLSLPTVSRVLSGSNYPIADETRRRVQAAANSLGYRPNLAARGLRTKRTSTVGIIVDDIMSAFVPPIVRGIQDRLAAADYSGLIVNVDWNPELERIAIADLLSRPVDGLLFVEYSHQASDELISKSEKPCFFVHRLFGTPIQNSVVPDDYNGSVRVVDHLVALGHRRIGLISGPVNWHSARKRNEGFASAAKRHELRNDPALISYGDWETESGYSAAMDLLNADRPPTAIFAANDLMALGAIYAVQDAGLDVPHDIAIVGYDNREFTSIVRPSITTMSMPVYEMGCVAADLLLDQISERCSTVDELRIQGELMIRESCGAPPPARCSERTAPVTMLRRLLLNREPER